MSLSLFYNNVSVLDYAYLVKGRGVVGGSLIVNVELAGTTDSEGVIFDFSLAKKKVKEIIDFECDHRLVVPTKSSELKKLEFKNQYSLLFENVSYMCPKEGLCLIKSEVIDEKILAKYLEEIIFPKMPKEVSNVKITFDKESSNTSDDLFFHYTHGLKQHYGNCQRLLHGHRSTLKVFGEGKRKHDIERWLVEDVFNYNIHFAFKDNVLSTNSSIITLGYTSLQGEFSLAMPAKDVHIVPIETTVENLSKYFLELCRDKFPKERQLVVWAYEGVAKGAKSSF